MPKKEFKPGILSAANAHVSVVYSGKNIGVRILYTNLLSDTICHNHSLGKYCSMLYRRNKLVGLHIRHAEQFMQHHETGKIRLSVIINRICHKDPVLSRREIYALIPCLETFLPSWVRKEVLRYAEELATS